jgi:hypothetical protein
MFGQSGGLRADQLEIERDRDSTGDLILQGEQIAQVAIEPLSPEMRVGRGIDQLGRTRSWLPERRTLPSST